MVTPRYTAVPFWHAAIPKDVDSIWENKNKPPRTRTRHTVPTLSRVATARRMMVETHHHWDTQHSERLYPQSLTTWSVIAKNGKPFGVPYRSKARSPLSQADYRMPFGRCRRVANARPLQQPFGSYSGRLKIALHGQLCPRGLEAECEEPGSSISGESTRVRISTPVLTPLLGISSPRARSRHRASGLMDWQGQLTPSTKVLQLVPLSLRTARAPCYTSQTPTNAPVR